MLILNPVFAKELCYEFTTSQVEGVHNKWTLCIDGEKATNQIYYPNTGFNSTICKQNGAIKYSESKLSVTLEEGQCENKRTQMGFKFNCSTNENSNLNCKDEKFGYTLEFLKLTK